MRFENACFISYRNAQADWALSEQFIDLFSATLKAALGACMNEGLYVDRDRLVPGARFNEELAINLCRSICMIVIYTLHYFDIDYPYCAREYKAMEVIEEIRKRAVPKEKLRAFNLNSMSLIIPVVLRGEERLPPLLKSHRNCVSFNDFMLSSRRMKYSAKYGPRIKRIAEQFLITNYYLIHG